MNMKKIITYVFILVLLQVYRIIGRIIIFNFVEHSIMNDVIVNLVLTGIPLVFIIIMSIKRELFIFDNKYLVIFSLILAYIFTMPFVKVNASLYNFLYLLYNSIVTVLYEEILFRGLIWKDIENSCNKTTSYIVSTILFALWHIGYMDTIIYRTSLFNLNADILNIIIWKVITAGILGIMFGGIRYKSKKINSSIAFHMLLNGIMS